MPMGSADGITPDGYAGIATWPTFAYALTSDGKAADRTQLRGGSGDIKPMALIKQSSGLSNNTLNGRYAYVAFNHDVSSDGDRIHSVFSGTFGANGTGNLGTGTIVGAELSRTANNSNSAALTGTALSANITGGSYSVIDTGSLSLSIVTDAANQPPNLMGRINGGGNFFYVRATEADTAATPQQVVQTSVLGIKVGTAAPSLSGKSYRFRASHLEYGPSVYGLYGHLAYSTLEFVDGTNAKLTINSQAIDRSNDITSLVTHPVTMGDVATGTYTTDVNGAFTVTLLDGTIIRGYVNAKSMLATHQRGFPASGALDISGSSAALGIALGRCVGC